MRQVVLDTETTGLRAEDGDRIIEIGCVEIIDRNIIGEFHTYLNPEREISIDATRIHGLTLKDLEDKPLFVDICDDFLDYVRDAELIIHNAIFDLSFLDAELKKIERGSLIEESACEIVDTLSMARDKHPGMKNSLDELCRRYNVDASQRGKHGALLDANLLTQVYLAITGGQTLFDLQNNDDEQIVIQNNVRDIGGNQLVIKASAEEMRAHDMFLEKYDMLKKMKNEVDKG